MKTKSEVPEVSFESADLAAAVGVIGGKWKVRIICYLLGGTKRFGELRHTPNPASLCAEETGLGLGVGVRRILLTVSRFGGWLLGGRGRRGSFWTPEVRISLDPVVRRVAHARIEDEEVRLTLLN
jgi:hypothetical protein